LPCSPGTFLGGKRALLAASRALVPGVNVVQVRHVLEGRVAMKMHAP
jgi:hypothetical protein